MGTHIKIPGKTQFNRTRQKDIRLNRNSIKLDNSRIILNKAPKLALNKAPTDQTKPKILDKASKMLHKVATDIKHSTATFISSVMTICNVR